MTRNSQARLLNPAIATAAASLGMTATFAPVHDDAGVESAIAAMAREPGGGVITLPDSFNALHRDAILAAAARHHLPLLGVDEFFARAGAVMSYSVDLVRVHAQAASYIDRILGQVASKQQWRVGKRITTPGRVDAGPKSNADAARRYRSLPERSRAAPDWPVPEQSPERKHHC